MKKTNIFFVFVVLIIFSSTMASAFWPFDWFMSRYFSSDKPPEFSIVSPINNSNLQEGSRLTIKWK